MRLPKKITPDALLEAFVEVHYTTQLPPEVVYGTFFRALVPTFTYVAPNLQVVPAVGGAMQVQDEPLFQGQGVYFRLRSGHVSFGVSGNTYPGWEHYYAVIQQVLTTLTQSGEIEQFTRVGLRYINALPWRPLNEQLEVQLPQLPSGLTTERMHYRAQLRTADRFLVNLSLYSSPVADAPGGDAPAQSLFDVDIIWETPDMPDLPAVLARISLAHQREKEVFWGLLNPSFRASLQPEYE